MSAQIIELASARSGTRTWLVRLVNRLAEADRRYRERRYIEEMNETQLRDIGLTREDLRRAFRDPGASDRT